MVAIYAYEQGDKLAHELGLYILEQQNKAFSQNGNECRFNVAISGGSLINVLNAALLKDPVVSPQIRWSHWNVYFCDERLVPLEHADSNYGAFKTHILDPLTFAGTQEGPIVYTINESLLGEDSNDRIADLYAEQLPKFPFDLILLGCGPDGHTCSLFPGAAHKPLLEERSKSVVWCKNSPKPPSDRITFTFPVLEAARALAFVATGSGKRAVLRSIFDDRDTNLPSALVNSRCGCRVGWFCDTPALKDTNATYTSYCSRHFL